MNGCPNGSNANIFGDCMAQQVERVDDQGRPKNEGEMIDTIKYGYDRGGCSWNRHVEGVLCYIACPDGFFGRADNKCWANGANSDGVTRKMTERGYSCGDNQSLIGAICYNNCRPGYHFVGGNICEPDGGGARITATSMDREYCNDDEVLKDHLCYKKCRDGFNSGATICDFSKDVKRGNFIGHVSNCK
jgi:hypothetical protein